MNKFLLYSLLFSVVLNGMFGYLSYSFYGDKLVAEKNLEGCQKANKTLQDNLEAERQACEILDNILSEYQKEKRDLDDKKDQAIDFIDQLSPRVIPKAEQSIKRESVNEENVVPLDGKLPPALTECLYKVYSGREGGC